jgi:hypothetical protein
VARAALREPDLPVARLDGVERELRLLVDHREDLVAERTRIISRLRWHLHELDPGWTGPAKVERTSAFNAVAAHLEVCADATVVRRLALRLVEHLRMLTTEIDELAAEITERVTIVAPPLLASLAAVHLRRPRSSVRPPRCIDSAPRTRSRDSTGLRRYRCGHRTSSDTVCRAPEIVNSTPRCIASR